MLAGKHVIVTAGPTHEPIDPVRYMANRSSGKQGFAIAGALSARGARVTLIAGPVRQATPATVMRIDVETAREMAAAVEMALPADAAVLVAAVADWRVETAPRKLKKCVEGPPTLALVENPDILAELARSPRRPELLVGFAAETDDVIANAVAKRARKDCDWIVANDVSGDVMGGEANAVHLVTADGVESWPRASKDAVAERLAERIAVALAMGDRPYHAHIYYSADERDAAARLRDAFAADQTRIRFVGRMTDCGVGPHPLPQFEVHFESRALAAVVDRIATAGLRALVHPMTDDDVADHTRLAQWIGEPLALDVSVLDPPGYNQGIPRFGKADF